MWLVAAAIASLGSGVVGEAVLIVATAAAYACHDAVSPFRAILCRSVIACAGMAFAMVAFDGVAVIWALGFSFSAATLISAAYLHWRHHRLRNTPKTHGQFRLAGELAASLVAMVPGWIIWNALSSTERHDFLIGFAAIASSGLTYLTAQWLRGSREFSALFMFGKPPRRQAPVEWSDK
jgi:peptidoglycan biosynthesis protein MviN/MurJ (putative lipid II flippase)